MNGISICGKILEYMNKYMKEALTKAGKAFDLGEVPIGAVIVRSGEIIARRHNVYYYADRRYAF